MTQVLNEILGKAERSTSVDRRWRKTVDIKQFLSGDNSDAGAQAAAKQIATQIRARLPEFEDVEEFDCVVTAGDLNCCLDLLYDYADEHRVWLGLKSTSV